MAQLHQVQLSYDPTEDRAVLRIRTHDNSEFTFWLTRRYVKLLWPVLMQMLESHPQVANQTDTAAKR